MITTHDLTRTYGEFVAVDRLSCSIGKGEIVGLLGHNGAGKTTIMKMLTGFLEPTSGRIEIDGIDALSDPLAVRKKIGYLPENCPLYPEMSVIGYLDYAAGLHGVSEAERPARLREVIARTGLEKKAAARVSTLSRGYRQRVGVAQAILHQPEILILDEPTNGLDPTQIQHMRTLIRELAGQATIILSTHILQEVQAVCSRVIIIRNGRMALDAGLDELQKQGRVLVATDAETQALQAALGGVDFVRGIESIPSAGAGNRFALTLTDDADRDQACARISRQIMDSGYQLFALEREQRTLETIFGEITADEGRMAS